jgi:hypothetical protein
MLNSQVIIGRHYIAKVSGRLTVVHIFSKGYPRGWCGTNLWTNHDVYFKTAGRLRREATTEEIDRKSYGLPQVPMVESVEPVVDKPSYFDLSEALTDMLETETWETIRHFSGLPQERCEEIMEIHRKLI